MSLEAIREKNRNMNIYEVSDEAFRKYGRVVGEFDFSEMINFMGKETSIPAESNVYVASVPEMEALSELKKIEEIFYGSMPIQIGYCNGPNSKLNGLEYHKGSEIDVAATDLVLLLGKVKDIVNNSYSSDKVEAFYLKKGTAVELYGTTLHFAPCKVLEEGFKCIVILPKGTNLPLENRPFKEVAGEERLLMAKNKWLLCHPERKVLVEKGVFEGISGTNIEIRI